MAKLFGLNGYASGKLGNSILAIRAGQQVVRQYNPAPNNPKSEKQQAQRAKGNVCGLFGKRIPADLLLFNIAGGSQRRSEFNKILLLASKSAKVSGVWQGSLIPEDIKFSNGSIRADIAAGTGNLQVEASLGTFTASWTAYGLSPSQNSVIIFVLRHAKYSGVALESEEYFVTSKIVPTNTMSADFTISSQVLQWSGDVVEGNVWAVPIDENEVLALVGQPLSSIAPTVVADLTTRVGSRSIYGETMHIYSGEVSI